MKTSLQSQNFNSIGLWSPNRYEMDLSNEALNIDFDQGAAKISVVKVGGRKKKSACSALISISLITVPFEYSQSMKRRGPLGNAEQLSPRGCLLSRDRWGTALVPNDAFHELCPHFQFPAFINRSTN